MSDTIIYWVNLLVTYQKELLVFTDHKGELIGDGNVDLTCLDGGRYESEAKLKIKN